MEYTFWQAPCSNSKLMCQEGKSDKWLEAVCGSRLLWRPEGLPAQLRKALRGCKAQQTLTAPWAAITYPAQGGFHTAAFEQLHCIHLLWWIYLASNLNHLQGQRCFALRSPKILVYKHKLSLALLSYKVSAYSPSAPSPITSTMSVCPSLAPFAGHYPTPMQPQNRAPASPTPREGCFLQQPRCRSCPWQWGAHFGDAFSGSLPVLHCPEVTGAHTGPTAWPQTGSAPPLFPPPSSPAGTLFLLKLFLTKKCYLARLRKSQWASR